MTASQFQWSTVPGTGASVLTWSLESFAGGTSSLPDGYYQLTLPSGLITDAYGVLLDGAGDGQPGGDYVANFFVLQGDVNGDGVVNSSDMAAVNAALGSRPGSSNWNPNADLDRDGYGDDQRPDHRLQQHGRCDHPAAATDAHAGRSGQPAGVVVWRLRRQPHHEQPARRQPGERHHVQRRRGGLVLGGNAVELSGNIVNQSPNAQTINLPLTLIGGSPTIDTASGDVTIAGNIGQTNGSLGIVKTGPGTLVLSGANTYAGSTTVLAGMVQVNGAQALPVGGCLTIGGGGTFVFGGSSTRRRVCRPRRLPRAPVAEGVSTATPAPWRHCRASWFVRPTPCRSVARTWTARMGRDRLQTYPTGPRKTTSQLPWGTRKPMMPCCKRSLRGRPCKRRRQPWGTLTVFWSSGPSNRKHKAIGAWGGRGTGHVDEDVMTNNGMNSVV